MTNRYDGCIRPHSPVTYSPYPLTLAGFFSCLESRGKMHLPSNECSTQRAWALMTTAFGAYCILRARFLHCCRKSSYTLFFQRVFILGFASCTDGRPDPSQSLLWNMYYATNYNCTYASCVLTGLRGNRGSALTQPGSILLQTASKGMNYPIGLQLGKWNQP